MKTLLVAAIAALALVAPAGAATVGTTLPADFPSIIDASQGTPLLGFGAAGPVGRTPVIFVHGNNDTPFPTPCAVFGGNIHNFAQNFADRGYALSELWGVGYQGDQCDTLANPLVRSGLSHTSVASVPDLRAFVHAVLDYTGAKQVDIVAHSLGGTVTREWMRQDSAYHLVRRFVAVASPFHGIINCSPNPANYWQLFDFGGFVPSSPVCQELGAHDTPFLTTLNQGRESHGPTRTLVLWSADADLVYISAADGFFPAVPAENYRGEPWDFSESPKLEGARNVGLTNQGAYDLFGSGHLGIINSPEAWQLAYEWLTAPESVVVKR
jgi:pimeloyl-ACP methyl ester carboxylesterase